MARGPPHGSSGRVFRTALGYAVELGRLGVNSCREDLAGHPAPALNRFRRKPVLGGLINEYTRAAWTPANRRSLAESYFRAGQDLPVKPRSSAHANLASDSQGAGGDDYRLLMAVRGHLGARPWRFRSGYTVLATYRNRTTRLRAVGFAVFNLVRGVMAATARGQPDG